MRSRLYRRWICSLPCAVCRAHFGIEAAHTGPRGLGTKSSDFSCIPLCRRHHQSGNDSLHALGPQKFQERHDLDIPALVESLNRIGMAGLKQHGPARKQVGREFTRARCICGWQSAWYRSLLDAQGALYGHINNKEAA
jgi:hypothetical protein